ncbi:lipid II-degrading bacteriocin [Pseudomonas azerbaijanorientalis]|uniref:lipid II-degrading bacteriocin n=1 Tax=Pseudomonas azerbaijanorientalis TaxID=2842350 RepID=UPI001C3E331B|nr:lipid II-degrading bacteriocin [Pseudomonas azerbaijanorientalis]QXH62931.1 lipid II-degrading bacteriocin [Pseudomonas azerbaijanorientalis]
MNTIELPPIYIYATEPGYSNPPGAPFPAPNPGVILLHQQQQRNVHYANGHWREMIIKLCNEQAHYGQVNYVVPGFPFDFGVMRWADTFSSNDSDQSPAQALNYASRQIADKKLFEYDTAYFSGGVLTPVAAMGHLVFGKGATARTNINKLSLQLSTTKMPLLETALAAAPVGISSIYLDKVPYNTANDSWMTASWLGSITLKIEGAVTKTADGRLNFNGNAKAYNDIYDGNPSTHRSWLGESSTAVLDAIHRVMNGQPYEIAIEGSLGVSINR